MARLGEIVCYKAGDDTEYAAMVTRVFGDKVALNIYDHNGGRAFVPVVVPGPSVGQYQTFETIEQQAAAELSADDTI